MKKKNIFFSIVLIVFFAINLIILPSCSQKDQSQEKVIKIGAILPLTGNLSFFGEQAKNAVILLQDELNSEGEKIEIVIYDSKSTPKDGLNAYKKAILEGIRYFYVSLDPIAKTILPQIEKDNAIIFVCSVDNDISKESKNVFRLYYGFKDQSLAQYNLIMSMKIKKVNMLLINVAHAVKYGDEYLGKKLRESGIEIGIETFDFKTKDFKDILTKILSDKPDVIVMSEYGPLYPVIFRDLKSIAKTIPTIICGIGMLNVKKEDYSLYENVIFASPEYLALEKENDFYNRYMSAYKSLPHYEAYYAYDSLKTLFIAIKNSKPSNQEIIEYLLNNEFSGVSQKKIKFDKNGDLEVSTKLMMFKNGEIVEYNQ